MFNLTKLLIRLMNKKRLIAFTEAWFELGDLVDQETATAEQKQKDAFEELEKLRKIKPRTPDVQSRIEDELTDCRFFHGEFEGFVKIQRTMDSVQKIIFERGKR